MKRYKLGSSNDTQSLCGLAGIIWMRMQKFCICLSDPAKGTNIFHVQVHTTVKRPTPAFLVLWRAEGHPNMNWQAPLAEKGSSSLPHQHQSQSKSEIERKDHQNCVLFGLKHTDFAQPPSLTILPSQFRHEDGEKTPPSRR